MKMLQWPDGKEEGRLLAIPCAGCDVVFWFDAARMHLLFHEQGLVAFSHAAEESEGACRAVAIESEDGMQVCMTLYCPECEKQLDDHIREMGGVVEEQAESMANYFGEPGEA